jgi:SAM-dependent methyltransferase
VSEYDPGKIAASYDAVAEEYAARLFHELDYKPFDRDLLDRVADRVRGRGVVCDLGCGPGHVARYLADRGVDAMGVDVSPGTVAVARRLNPGLRFEVGNMLELRDVADGAWVGVVALYSIIHIERGRVPDALAEIHRVLADDGVLVVAVHVGKGDIRHDEFMGKPVPFTGTFFERDELSGLIERAGFAIDDVHLRPPYADEGQTDRVYVVAHRPATSLTLPRQSRR